MSQHPTIHCLKRPACCIYPASPPLRLLARRRLSSSSLLAVFHFVLQRSRDTFDLPPPAPFRDAKSVDSLACQREKKRLNGCSKAQTTLTSRPSCLCRLLLKHCLHSLRQRDSLLAQSLVSYFRWAPNNAPRPSGSLDNARAAKNTPRKQQKKGQKASIDACEYGCQVCYCWLRTAPGRSCNAALLPALPLRLTLLRGRDVVLALRSPIQPVPCNLNLVYLAQCLRIRRCIFSLEQNKLTSLICLKSVRSLISHIKNNS